MDIVICVALKDCLIVKKNIYFIRKNINADIIYIITDKRNFIFFPKSYQQRYTITLIDEETIISNRNRLMALTNEHFTCKYRFGWYYQQFLKMEFALSPYAKEFYLIWDSDTIPLNPLSFIQQNKMIFTPKTEYHEAYFETLHRLIGYEKEADYSFIAEHMIISVPIMKELINKIGASHVAGDSWTTKIINATPPNDPNSFSEFETYGTYCFHNYKELFTLKDIRSFREGGTIYSRGISKWKLKKLSKRYDTITLESWDTPRKSFRKFYNNMEEWSFNFITRLRTH